MKTQGVHLTAPVRGPLEEADLVDQVVSDRFTAYESGDPDRIHAMLAGVASAPGGRVTVAVDPFAGIVGFCCLLPPLHGDRYSAVSCAIELVAVEVAHRYRGRGVFGHMFQSAVRDMADASIIYAIADPVFRDDGESKREFRDRMASVLGSVGFFPYPSTYAAAHIHRDAGFFVRKGPDVSDEDFEHFVDLLERADTAVTVAIVLRDSFLRNLIRTDLERNGFAVVSVGSESMPRRADVYITGPHGPVGDLLSIRLVDAEATKFRDSVIWLPEAAAESLPQVIRRETARRRSTRWLKSSSNE